MNSLQFTWHLPFRTLAMFISRERRKGNHRCHNGHHIYIEMVKVTSLEKLLKDQPPWPSNCSRCVWYLVWSPQWWVWYLLTCVMCVVPVLPDIIIVIFIILFMVIIANHSKFSCACYFASVGRWVIVSRVTPRSLAAWAALSYLFIKCVTHRIYKFVI